MLIGYMGRLIFAIGMLSVCAAAIDAADDDAKPLLGFGTDGARRPSRAAKGTATSPSPVQTPDARAALRISFPPFRKGTPLWPSITMAVAPDNRDWSGLFAVELDVHNPLDHKREFGISIGEGKDGPAAGYSYWDVVPGAWRKVSFDISLLARTIDVSNVGRIMFWQRLQVGYPEVGAVFDVSGVRGIPMDIRSPRALELRITRPPFRQAFFGPQAPARIAAALTINVSKDHLEGTSVTAQLLSKRDEVLAQRVVSPAPSPRPIVLETPSMAPGSEVLLRVSLRDLKGTPVNTTEKRVRCVAQPKDLVTIREDSVTLVNGRPFFPIGIYNARLQDFGMLAKIGFNCVGPYLTADEEHATEARKHGLRIISNVDRKAADPAVRVPSFAATGVVLAYYLFDEPSPGKESREAVKALCDHVAAADPYHLTCGCNNLHHGVYAGTSDVMMIDSYPAPGPFDEIWQRMDDGVKSMAGRGPVWFIPQTFPKIAYGPRSTDYEKIREPTYDEVRTMTWLGIIHGAQGAVYYSHRVQEQVIWIAYPGLWWATANVVRELRALGPVLLAPRWEGEVKCDRAEIHVAARGADGGPLLMAANPLKGQEVRATISVSMPDGHLSVLGEKRQVEVTNGSFIDTFAPRTTHLYCPAALEFDVPDVGTGRAEATELQQRHAERRKRDLAIYYKGATVAASWGFPEKSRMAPWLRMIDGYRTARWSFGMRGAARNVRWDGKKLFRGERWLEVRLPRKCSVSRCVVLSTGLQYRVALPKEEAWAEAEPAERSTWTDQSGPTEVDVFTFRFTPRALDRVRLNIRPPVDKKVRQRIYEIELYDGQ